MAFDLPPFIEALLLGSDGDAKLESLSYKIIDFDIRDEALADERDAERDWEPRPDTAKSVRLRRNQEN